MERPQLTVRLQSRRAGQGSKVLSDERERVAEELRRVRESVRDRALTERRPADVLGAAPTVRTPELAAAEPAPAPIPPVTRPDAAAINALWDVRAATQPGGLKGRVGRLIRRFMAPIVEAQVSFNSRQVQLDNELLAYIDARLTATHRHYDAVLGGYGSHLQDADKRHLILQEELVAHVHDLVRRIDLVLSESERGRLSLEFALRDLRARLEAILPHAGTSPKG